MILSMQKGAAPRLIQVYLGRLEAQNPCKEGAVKGCKRAELLVSLLEIVSNKLDSCSNRLLNELFVNMKIKLDY